VKRRQPDYIPIGSSVRLVSVDALARELGITRLSALRALRVFGVPVVRFEKEGKKEYFNLATLEVNLFKVLSPGGQGWTGERAGAVLKSELLQVDWPQQMRMVADIWGIMDRQRMRERCLKLGHALKKAKERLQGTRRIV